MQIRGCFLRSQITVKEIAVINIIKCKEKGDVAQVDLLAEASMLTHQKYENSR